jgi:hypothetical protein
MSLKKLLPLLVFTSMVVVGVAHADWTASGTFLFIDREFDQNGFTGVEPALPIRFATVEVRDPNVNGKRGLLASAATDANGAFSILVSDNTTRTVYIRVVSDSAAIPDLYLTVENASTPIDPYAIASADFVDHGPTEDVNIGTITAAIGSGAEPFHIYDVGLRAVDFLASLMGAQL